MKVRGISLLGKNRICEHGDEWEILERREVVTCLSNKPGILLRAKDGCIRWMKEAEDEDFEVVG